MDIDQRIAEILQDLYRIDPEFKNQEAKLKRLLTELLSVRPDVTLDDEFVASLRHRLLAAAREQESRLKAKDTHWFQSFSLRWAGSLALLVVAIGLAAFFIYGNQGKNRGQDQARSLLASKLEVHSLGTKAFGSLQDIQMNGMATGKGGGGAGGAADGRDASSTVPMGLGGGGGFSPEMVSYKYTYKGEDFEVPEGQLDIYKREKGLPSGLDATALLKDLDFGIINAAKFTNLGVQSISLAEDRDFGYSIYVSLQEGTISISQNWPKWPSIGKLCEGQGEECFRQNQMKIGDMPDDATTISIADAFLQEHNISTENYGQPFVNDYWKTDYDRAQDKASFYIPDTINVVYPLKLSGREVFDEGGTKIGLNVTVDARLKRASGMFELNSQRYQSSSYDTEADKDKLIGIAEKGGYHGGYYDMPQGRVVNVELGTPTLSFLRVWQYNTDITNELLVPALIFPVTKSSDETVTYRKNVVVPVIKDIIDKDESLPIRILPMPAQ